MLSVGQTGASVKVGLGLPRHLSARRHFRSEGTFSRPPSAPRSLDAITGEVGISSDGRPERLQIATLRRGDTSSKPVSRTELTEPTDRRPVMKRLSRTTVSCGTLPLPRVCGCGSRPGRASRACGSRTGRGRRGGRRSALPWSETTWMVSRGQCVHGRSYPRLRERFSRREWRACWTRRPVHARCPGHWPRAWRR